MRVLTKFQQYQAEKEHDVKSILFRPCRNNDCDGKLKRLETFVAFETSEAFGVNVGFSRKSLRVAECRKCGQTYAIGNDFKMWVKRQTLYRKREVESNQNDVKQAKIEFDQAQLKLVHAKENLRAVKAIRKTWRATPRGGQ